MAEGGEETTSGPLSPDEAFSILGNETRVGILRVLGDAEGPLSFSALRDAVGIRQGAQFNYHLDKLVGHFVEKVEDGYALRQPGKRVVQAVLSGAVTGDPELHPTEVDFSCLYCGAPVEVRYRDGELHLSCTACHGNYEEQAVRERPTPEESGNLSNISLPPAGIEGRTAQEILDVAAASMHLDALAASSGICPRCSAPVDRSVLACEEHDTSQGLCSKCGDRYAVRIHVTCRNCTYERAFSAVMGLLDRPELTAFVAEHGFNTTSDGLKWGWEYEETLRSVDPFEGEFTFTIDGDSLTVRVDEDFDVLHSERS
jgi:hypothetical protein